MQSISISIFREKLIPGANDLRTTHRELLKEWNIETPRSQAKLRLPVYLKEPPQSPESPNPSNDGLVDKNSTPISPHQSSAESAEGVTETQGVIAFAGGHRISGLAHRPGGDDPHWGPRPTTNGKEAG